MELLIKWLLLAGIQAGATMSPGPAFAMSVRNAIKYGRNAGIFSAIGLGLGVGVHVLLVFLGFAVLVSQSVMLFTVIKYAGAAYLIYIGTKALFSKKQKDMSQDLNLHETTTDETKITAQHALWIGLMTNLLNPKAMIFFSAVLSQFITPDISYGVMALYLVTVMSIETIWFAIVTIVLTNNGVKERFMRFSHWIERVCGGLLIGLGVRLASSKALAP